MVTKIEIQNYDPRWVDLQESEIAALRSVLGDVDIQAVGSTAVPGLASKPIIDLLVGVGLREDFGRIVSQLRNIGFQEGQSPSAERETAFLSREPLGALPKVHLHVARLDSRHWRDLIDFRDALRANASLAVAYEALKRSLAAAYAHDALSYTAGKTGFVNEVLGGVR